MIGMRSMMVCSSVLSRSRLQASAATTKVMSAMVAAKAWTTSSECVAGRSENGPCPRTVPCSAMVESSSTATAAARRSKRRAIQSSGGIDTKASGEWGSAAGEEAPEAAWPSKNRENTGRAPLEAQGDPEQRRDRHEGQRVVVERGRGVAAEGGLAEQDQGEHGRAQLERPIQERADAPVVGPQGQSRGGEE